jgi:threonine/homoserine/homoserine lactone efflux protein
MTEFWTLLDWRAFLLAMVVIELTPGPNMGWLAALSAQYGKRVGLMAVAGVTLGLMIQVLAAAIGLSAIISNFPLLYHSIRWAGVIFMLWLAWEAFANTASAAAASDLSEKGFRRGLIANLLNPKALVFYVVIVGQFSSPDIGALWWQILILGGLHLIIALIVHVLIVLAGAKLGDRFETWRTSLTARLAFSLSLVAIAIWIAISTA